MSLINIFICYLSNRLRVIREVDFHIKNNQNLCYDIRVDFISGKIHLSKVEIKLFFELLLSLIRVKH